MRPLLQIRDGSRVRERIITELQSQELYHERYDIEPQSRNPTDVPSA